MSWISLFTLFAGAAAVWIFVRTFLAAPRGDVTIVPPKNGPFSSLLSSLCVLSAAAVLSAVVIRSAPLFGEASRDPAEVQDAINVELSEPDQIRIPEETPPQDTADANGEPLPEWVGEPDQEDGGRLLISLSSTEQPTRADAEKELLGKALARIRADFEQTHRTTIPWDVPESAVHFTLTHEEKITRTAAAARFTMVRLHRQLELSPETREEAVGAFRQAVINRRLRGIAAVGGTLALIVAASAVYLRLDARTLGQTRGRLKAATAAAILTGGLVATLWV